MKTTLLREKLRAEFSARATKNPSYSLRAFAKHLGVSHSLLSLILSGQRAPSLKVLEAFIERLAIVPEEAQLLRQEGTERKNNKKSSSKSKSAVERTYSKISLDRFALISEWQHYAILSLLEVEDTELTPEFIAHRLGITPFLAKQTLSRLFDLGLIEKEEKTNRWKQSSAPIVVENTESTVHSRRFQSQLISKALESLENDPMPLRDISSITFAMDPKHVNYAMKKIREFRRTLSAELEAFGTPQEVYNLTVQLFPSSRRENDKKN